jgi:hypothetical protein
VPSAAHSIVSFLVEDAGRRDPGIVEKTISSFGPHMGDKSGISFFPQPVLAAANFTGGDSKLSQGAL